MAREKETGAAAVTTMTTTTTKVDSIRFGGLVARQAVYLADICRTFSILILAKWQSSRQSQSD